MGFNFFYTTLFQFIFIIALFGQNGNLPMSPPVEMNGYNHTYGIGAQHLWPSNSLGLNLKGNNYTVHQWEIPLAPGGHPDTNDTYLLGRISYGDVAVGFSSHATEMARIMIGQGADSSLKGIAYEAQVKAYDYYNVWAEYMAAAPNMKQSLHAYAGNNGWSTNSAVNGTFWCGLEEIDTLEDYNYGIYDNRSRLWDSILHKNPYLITVKSVGNDRGESHSGKHYFYKSVGGSTSNYIIDSSTIARQDDGGIDGYDGLPSGSVSKNLISVGAVDFINGGWQSPSDVVIRPGSSFGPADDGRVKPDIVAAGEKTSQSSAAVSGATLLLREHFNNTLGKDPLSSSLKGLLIHTADEAGPYDGPDYKFGWGMMNAQNAAKHISNLDFAHTIIEDTLLQGDTLTYYFYCPGLDDIKATLCWTDPEGNPIPFANSPNLLDNPTPMLVNDLDLRLEERNSGCVKFPYLLDPQNPDSAAKLMDNSVDNVEHIYWQFPEKGWFSLKVYHKASLQTSSQVFSLLLSGARPGLVFNGSSWIPKKPDVNTYNFDVLIMEGAKASLPNDFKANVLTIEKKAELRFY